VTGELLSACSVCHQLVDDIGPWCNLFVVDRYCDRLRNLRKRIFEADRQGDGAMVNALCHHIRVRTNDRFVP
jgi:hypothetical protein